MALNRSNNAVILSTPKTNMAANDDINETASGRFYDNEIIYVL